jgi:hypothetical protein
LLVRWLPGCLPVGAAYRRATVATGWQTAAARLLPNVFGMTAIYRVTK